MTTSFSSVPIVDLGALKLDGAPLSPSEEQRISTQLYDIFATTGFAYLINTPLSFSHDEVFGLAKEFFGLPLEEKMAIAKKTFQPLNANTYRGYFPIQPLASSDNLKEGFEMGPTKVSSVVSKITKSSKFDFSEPNVWPSDSSGQTLSSFRTRMEQLYGELQALASQLLSLLALSLGKQPDFFAHYLKDSLSTLRLLHYPPAAEFSNCSLTSLDSGVFTSAEELTVKLSCTPHTDSGILTLLHQDAMGGLEVLNATKQWVPAPYVPGSLVVNIGDLMAEVSGGRFIATLHRVRAPPARKDEDGETMDFGRFSVPFFFEPGEVCLVKSVDEPVEAEGIMYGDHVRAKMKTWVEFQDLSDYESD
ncbi:Clavaminate synthase-like protein [Xylariaceae sp. FL1651]|nr:Clavaminate synthase-like protein [Xylariaceae sp. FL1651]